MANPTPSDVNEATAPAIDDQGASEVPSLEWTRSDLDDYAEGLGLNEARALPNKQAVLDAITQTQPETPAEPEPSAVAESTTDAMRFRVLKAVTLDDGRTIMPGETLEIAADDASWPARRPKQLVGQKYLRPMNDAAKDATRGSDDDA